MKAPQIILIVFLAIEMGYQMAMHGKDKGQFNFPIAFLTNGILIGLLYWGGFWD